jgi:hypothetical protein
MPASAGLLHHKAGTERSLSNDDALIGCGRFARPYALEGEFLPLTVNRQLRKAPRYGRWYDLAAAYQFGHILGRRRGAVRSWTDTTPANHRIAQLVLEHGRLCVDAMPNV